jgi:hypothetical protein
MNIARIAGVALLSATTLSCSSVAPIKVSAGDQCFRCRRSILDQRVATEIIDRNLFVSKFRGPGCMAKYLAGHPDENGVIYVTDYPSGKMLRPAAAFYVPLIVDRKTGESDYRAYRVQAEAQTAAADLRTAPLSWDAVLERAR